MYVTVHIGITRLQWHMIVVRISPLAGLFPPTFLQSWLFSFRRNSLLMIASCFHSPANPPALADVRRAIKLKHSVLEGVQDERSLHSYTQPHPIVPFVTMSSSTSRVEKASNQSAGRAGYLMYASLITVSHRNQVGNIPRAHCTEVNRSDIH